MNPLVSVVIPAWNAERTLARTLASTCAQTLRDIEIIVVDDGATDRTAEIAREFQSRDPRVRLVQKKNGGLASARNAGIEAARATFVAPVDADDLWHPDKLRRQLEVMTRGGPDMAMVYALFRLIDDDDRVIRSGPRFQIAGRVFHRLLYTNFVGNGSGLLLRTSVARELGGYEADLKAKGGEGCEDLLLQLRVARHWTVGVVPDYLVGYRYHAGSMSSRREQMYRSWSLAMDALREQGVQFPDGVHGWGEAEWLVVLAGRALRERDWALARKRAGRALRLDPAGSLLFFWRHVAERLPGTVQAGPLRPFYDYAPDEAPGGNAPGLVRRRLDRLTALDRAPALAAAGQRR